MIYCNQYPIRAALFDLDDLLVDSTLSRAGFIVEAVRQLGIPVPDPYPKPLTEILSKCDGHGTLSVWDFPAAVLAYTDARLQKLGYSDDIIAARDAEQFMQHGCSVLRDCMNAAPDESTVLLDGARELLAFLKEQNIPTGIISNAAQKNIPSLLARLGIEDMIDIVFGDDKARRTAAGQVINKSSDPSACFTMVIDELHALSSAFADIQPHEIIYAGDRPSDIKFAHAVGCIGVHIPSTILPISAWPPDVPAPQIIAQNLNALRKLLDIQVASSNKTECLPNSF